MPQPRPPPHDESERRAIEAALAKDKSAEPATKPRGNPLGNVLGGLVVAALVAAGAYYALEMAHQNDDVQPILPPPPSTPVAHSAPASPAPRDLPKPTAPVPTAPKAPDEAPPATRHRAPAASGHALPEQIEAAVGGEGQLAVACKPECEIEIDGKPTGRRSPQTGMPVAAGKHRIRLVNHQVNLSTTDVVEIRPNEKTTKFYNLVLSQ